MCPQVRHLSVVVVVTESVLPCPFATSKHHKNACHSSMWDPSSLSNVLLQRLAVSVPSVVFLHKHCLLCCIY